MMLNFKYDTWRGGFYLGFLKSVCVHVQSAFDGLMSIHFDKQGQIQAIESFFGDHGGIPLRKIPHQLNTS